jgi:hypothetical protein
VTEINLVKYPAATRRVVRRGLIRTEPTLPQFREACALREKQMTTTQMPQRYYGEDKLMEIMDTEGTPPADDTWRENLGDEDDAEDDGDLLDAAPGNARKSLVGWANDAIRSVKPVSYVAGDAVLAVKQWALAARRAVVQCWDNWTGHEEAVVETRKVLFKNGCVLLRKPVEMSLHEKRRLKAKLVKRITNEEQDLVMHRD